MDPFEVEASTPSPQNNGSGGESVHSDDFVKVGDSSSLLLDLNADEQPHSDRSYSESSPPVELSPPSDQDLISGFMDSPTDDASIVTSSEPAAFLSDKGVETADQFHELEPNPPSNSLLDLEEPLQELNEPASNHEEFSDFGTTERIAEDDSDSPVEDNLVENTESEETEFKPVIKMEDVSEKFESVPEKTKVEEVPVPSKPVKIEQQARPQCCVLSPCVWFDQQKLHPKVSELLYWRDVKKSGISFGGILLILLSLTYFSFISVVAYLSLGLLGITMSFRIYKSILTAVQKSNDGHPFKDFLDKDFTPSSEKVKEISELILEHINCSIKRVKALFLVEDIVDSIKFGLVLWVLTYIGAWFNGMTLVILAFVAAFTLPKVYETHQTQIDHYLAIANQQVKEVLDKVKEKVPMLNRKKEE